MLAVAGLAVSRSDRRRKRSQLRSPERFGLARARFRSGPRVAASRVSGVGLAGDAARKEDGLVIEGLAPMNSWRPVNKGENIMKIVTLKNIPEAPAPGAAAPTDGYSGPVHRTRQT